MRHDPHPRDMSVASMRVELLELLAVLFPEKRWRKRVAARRIADYTIKNLPDAIRARPNRGRPHAGRAMHLATAINIRLHRS
jgi:hypothetical protein